MATDFDSEMMAALESDGEDHGTYGLGDQPVVGPVKPGEE